MNKPQRKPCNPTNPINVLQFVARLQNLRFRNTRISVQASYTERKVIVRCAFEAHLLLVRKVIVVNIRHDIRFDYRAIFELVKKQIESDAREVCFENLK